MELVLIQIFGMKESGSGAEKDIYTFIGTGKRRDYMNIHNVIVGK